MFILDSRESMPTPMMVNLKHEANEIGADFDVDLFSGLPPPATAMPGAGEGEGGGVAAAAATQQRAKGAEVSAADIAQALVKQGEGKAAGDGEEGGSDSSGDESMDELSGGEMERDETPDVPAVDLA